GFGPDRGGQAGHRGGARHQPAFLDPVVGAGREDAGLPEGGEVTTARRVAAILLLGIAAFAAPGLIAAPAASAHPLGNFTVNRYSGLLLAPGRVTVRYVLDMAEIPTFQETPNIDTDGDGTVSDAERGAWAQRKAPDILARLSLSVDGRPVQ